MHELVLVIEFFRFVASSSGEPTKSDAPGGHWWGDIFFYFCLSSLSNVN
jgi:hypothetical protein